MLGPRVATLVLSILVLGFVVAEEPAPNPPAVPAIPVVKLAPQKMGPPTRALKHQLLPDPLDQTAGNAAHLWLRTALAARGVKNKEDGKQWNWGNATETPLRNLPLKEVRDFLIGYAETLRLAEDASRRERCDWETPPLTIQTISQLPLVEVQSLREIANLLNLRCRLELAEGKFEQALRTLQIGFSLARHVGEGDTLIQQLVGIAIASIMLGRVEEMIQLPGSPNLYWALTQLPSPLIDCRRAMRSELNTLHRSFPQLREAVRAPLSAEKINHLADEVGKLLEQAPGDTSAWSMRLGLAALVVKVYPDARKSLLARGRTVAEVEAMPHLQVVVIHFVEGYENVKDEYLKWVNLPPWQTWAGLERNEGKLREQARKDNPLVGLLLPALTKVVEAQLRVDWQVAYLRTAEALRLYAAGHKGQPPEKLEDVTEVPLPLNPFTGKSFEASYSVKDGQGLLEIRPPARLAAQLGRRFELAPPAEK